MKSINITQHLAISASSISTAALLWGIATPSAQALFVPDELGPGDMYHLIFLTRDSRNAANPFIDPYNQFVQEQAQLNPSLSGTDQGIIYKAIASTLSDNVSARNNALVEAPVYLMDGTFIASGFDDLWNTEMIDNKLLPSPINVTQFGVVDTSAVFVATGTNFDGTLASNPLGVVGNINPESVLGDPQERDIRWINDVRGPNGPLVDYQLYALSQKLTVPGDPPPPEPNPDLGFLDNLVRGQLLLEDPVPVLNETEIVVDPGVEFSFLDSDLLFEMDINNNFLTINYNPISSPSLVTAPSTWLFKNLAWSSSPRVITNLNLIAGNNDLIANTLFGDDSIEIEIAQLTESNSWTFEIETQSSQSVPEPSTIIGLFLVGGLGLSLKGNKRLK